jgi:hypothetical protein
MARYIYKHAQSSFFFSWCRIEVLYETEGLENPFLTLIAMCNSRLLEIEILKKILMSKQGWNGEGCIIRAT